MLSLFRAQMCFDGAADSLCVHHQKNSEVRVSNCKWGTRIAQSSLPEWVQNMLHAILSYRIEMGIDIGYIEWDGYRDWNSWYPLPLRLFRVL